MAVNRGLLVVLGVSLTVCLLVAGILVGYLGIPRSTDNDKNSPEFKRFKELIKEADDTIAKRITDEIDNKAIEEYLKLFSSQPHVAGTPADLEQANYLRDKWLEFGLDEVNILPYNVLLSYPGDVKQSPNMLQILEENDILVHEATLNEPILDPQMNRSDALPPWLAYTPSGEVEGELVYANQGSLEDFKQLTGELGINITGKIVIMRYGGLYRGDKVKHAQLYGAKGAIIFSDPGDVTKEGAGVFPNSKWLPGYGAQRGSTLIGYGDPLTPGYPAIDFTPRISIKDAENAVRLLKIPAQPIGYADAIKFFESMDPSNVEAPQKWRGKMNTTYWLGPKMVNNRKVKLISRNTRKTRTTYNTIGIIRGSIEPDRYVMVGGHRDAWVFGAIDNVQGTALLHELARVFGKLLKEGWRPRRSIIFGSWGAEEYGLIGANEFAEEFSKNIAERAVAYINADVTVLGQRVYTTESSPLLKSIVYRATKFVQSPDTEFNTLYDFWTSRQGKDLNDPTIEPSIGKLGAGSDHAPFYNRIGVPCMSSGYFDDDGYPLYHSAYEMFSAVKNYIDPTFEYQQAAGRLVGEVIRLLGDELVLPIDVRYYSKDIAEMFVGIKELYEQKLSENDITLSKFEGAVENFTTATDLFDTMVKEVDKQDPIAVRMLNDKMIMLERAFIDPLGLPGRPLYRHIVAAPSRSNAYAGVGFPGIVDAIAEAEDAPVDKKVENWRVVQKEVAKATFALKSAASTLMGHVKLGR